MFVISTDLVLNFVDKVVVVVDVDGDDGDVDDDCGGGDVECRDDDDDDDDSGGGILVVDCIDGESCCKTLVPDGDVIGVEGGVIGVEGFDDSIKWVDDDGDDDDDGGDDVFKVEATDDGDSGATSNLDVGRILSDIAWSILLLSK